LAITCSTRLRCLDFGASGLEAGGLLDETASLRHQPDDGSVQPIYVLTNFIKRTRFHANPRTPPL
jgi:hypothetical protein